MSRFVVTLFSAVIGMGLVLAVASAVSIASKIAVIAGRHL